MYEYLELYALLISVHYLMRSTEVNLTGQRKKSTFTLKSVRVRKESVLQMKTST